MAMVGLCGVVVAITAAMSQACEVLHGQWKFQHNRRAKTGSWECPIVTVILRCVAVDNCASAESCKCNIVEIGITTIAIWPFQCRRLMQMQWLVNDNLHKFLALRRRKAILEIPMRKFWQTGVNAIARVQLTRWGRNGCGTATHQSINNARW